nr:MAG TPA: hypothetical protein [Caudoviricetes sp.]
MVCHGKDWAVRPLVAAVLATQIKICKLLQLVVLKLITIFLRSQFMRYGKELNDGKDIKRLY